jgi:hypothetical protein
MVRLPIDQPTRDARPNARPDAPRLAVQTLSVSGEVND